MKTLMFLALPRAIAAAALLVAWLVGASQVRAAGLSCTGVPKSGDVTSNPIACTVFCGSGGRIAPAVALAPRTTDQLTITIHGRCFEAISDLGYSRIAFRGGSAGATIEAPSASTDPVVAIGGHHISFRNLTISGGVVGLQGNHGAQFNGANLVIRDASSADVLLNGATASLTASTMQNSGTDGIEENQGAVLFLVGGAIEGNARYGANVFGASSLYVDENAVIQNNRIAGAIASDGGSILVTAGVVGRNGAAISGVGGLEAGTGGHVRAETNSTIITENFVHGIWVYGGGTAFVDSGVAITNNSADGIHIEDGGAALIQGGSVISNNR
jgi:hypothetical protein